MDSSSPENDSMRHYINRFSSKQNNYSFQFSSIRWVPIGLGSNSQLPTPNSQLPTPNSQLPTPNSQQNIITNLTPALKLKTYKNNEKT